MSMRFMFLFVHFFLKLMKKVWCGTYGYGFDIRLKVKKIVELMVGKE